MRKRPILGLILSMLLTCSTFGQQTIVFVNAESTNTSAPSPSNPGSTWTGTTTKAFKYLQDGLTRADQIFNEPNPPASVQVWVRGAPTPGLVYKPTEGDGLDPDEQELSFQLRENVSIYGGFDTGDDELSDAEPATNITILSGDLSGNDGLGQFWFGRLDNSFHVVNGEDVDMDDDDVLDGFTIRGGLGGFIQGDPLDPREGGGLRLVNAGLPRIVRCIFEDNVARQGAGIFVKDSDATIRDCQFIGNLAGPYSNLVDGGSGGGIHVNSCAPKIVRCNFIRNRAGTPDGLTGELFTGNGGGVQVANEGSPVIFNCKFFGNSCGHVGGGFSTRDNVTAEETLVVNCTFVGNFAKDSGGGARVGFEGQVRFVQCTFVENSCGISSHGLEGSGGGLSVGRDTLCGQARTVVIDNSIFWNNYIVDSAAFGSQIALRGNYPGTATIQFCDIQDSDATEPGIGVQSGWTAPTPTAWLDIDPDFVEDPIPGSSGWGSSDDDYGDLNLNSGSPVINKGDCDLIPLDEADVNGNENSTEPLPLDLDMLTRQVLRVDMGAYEYQTPPDTCAGDTNGDDNVNVADLLAVINQWGLTGAPSGDVNYFPCGDGVVGIGDLLTVIMYWGVCPDDEEGTPAGAPQTVQDCLDSCAPLGIGTPEYAECVEKCINSLP